MQTNQEMKTGEQRLVYRYAQFPATTAAPGLRVWPWRSERSWWDDVNGSSTETKHAIIFTDCIQKSISIHINVGKYVHEDDYISKSTVIHWRIFT